MRVLLFRTLCDTGGVSTWMLEHARELDRRGIECDFWFCRKSRRLAEFEATGRVTLGPVWELAPRLESRRYDVAHVPSGDPLADVVARMAPPGTAIVATSHGSLARMFDRRNCTAFTAVSEGMAKLNQPWTDIGIEVITNGVDLNRYTPTGPAEDPPGRPVVAFVGRTTADEKDFPRFTRIGARLAARGYRVWVADAHAADWDRLRGRGCVELGVERWRPHSLDEMPQLYRSVARSGGIVLMTSRHEGFPLVPPEAAACGAPTAGPDVMGVREAIIPDDTGMLYEPGTDDADVAERIDAWLTSRRDVAEWSAQCAGVARAKFGVARMTDSYLRVYARRVPRAATDRTCCAAGAVSEEATLLRALWRRQAAVRSRFLTDAALGLVHHDYPDHALWCIRRALRADARLLVSPKKLRTLTEVAARLAFRPDRMQRRLVSRRAILARQALA